MSDWIRAFREYLLQMKSFGNTVVPLSVRTKMWFLSFATKQWMQWLRSRRQQWQFNPSTDTAQSRRLSSELQGTAMDAHNLHRANTNERVRAVVNGAIVLKRYLIQINTWSISSCDSTLLISVFFLIANHSVSRLVSLCSCVFEAQSRPILTRRSSLAISSSSAVDWFAIFRSLIALWLRCERFDLLARGIKSNTVADIVDFASIMT